MERLGYEKCVDWIENRINIPNPIPLVWKKMSERVLRENNLRVRSPKNKLELRKYISQIFEVINDTAKNLYGEVDLSAEQVKKYVKQFILVVNCKYIMMVVDEKDNMVGFGITVPSLADASKKSRGRLFPFGWARILYAPYAKPDTLELYLVGVRDEYKNKGVPAVLIMYEMQSAIEDGIKYAETGPMLETNIKVQSMWKRLDKIQHKRRRCWIKTL